MKVYVLGNPLVPIDSLPLRLIPKLRKVFTMHSFIEIDPTESFVPEGDSVILDTVAGIPQSRIFGNLRDFEDNKSVSVHDFDLGTHLALLLKLKKIRGVCVLGVPPSGKLNTIYAEVCSLIRGLAGRT